MPNQTKQCRPLEIAIDFDGTIVKHDYPRIGKVLPLAIETMLLLQEAGHKIILFTMRSGKELEEAVSYVESFGVNLYGVNENPTQHTWTSSPKVHADLYVDDRALGCPLIHPMSTKERGKRPSTHWRDVRK